MTDTPHLPTPSRVASVVGRRLRREWGKGRESKRMRTMRMKPVVGDKVFIREHVLADRDTHADWQCDLDVATFLSWLPRTEEEAYQSLQDAIEQQDVEGRLRFFMAVVRKMDEEVVGDVGITLLDNRIGEIGWFIRKQYWGMGYASEAAALMIHCGFRSIELGTIRASCRKENTPSENIMKKCGFRLADATDRRLNYYLRCEDWDI